jgi:exo-beta-1,3-glucanase (GH17 family)
MNQRILELAKQAGIKANSEQAMSPQEQLFAELIVQECISVINTKAAEVPVEDEYERMWKMGTEFAVYQIEKHLGVES